MAEWTDSHFTPEMEEKREQLWLEQKLYAFDPKAKGEWFVIDTPPPFTSGQLHMGHVLSYSYFDFIARYKRMKGFNVYYPQGWDTQGFPTETKVEAMHGRKEPKEFLVLCKQWTEQCIATMRKQMIRMGFSPDWDYEYRTMDPSYHKAVQKSLIDMYNAGDVYLGNHAVFYCWKCASALAKTDTDDVEEKSTLNYLLFKGVKTDGTLQDLQIATSRPELLHACVAVLYNPEDKRYSGSQFSKVLTPLGAEVPFIPDSDVDTGFGSGLVMVCTFGDKQDVVWWHRHKLKHVEAFDAHGRLLNCDALKDSEGKPIHLKKARDAMLAHLKEKGLLLKQEELTHFVKVHDRCKTPVELKLSKQWFAKVISHGDEILAAAKSMRWHPEFAIAHMIDWINTLEWDWVISRQRVFGTPIPFWHCPSCKKVIPAEETELPVDPRYQLKKCPYCGSELQGEQSVCDCWVDSSITPLAIAKWLEDKGFFSKAYPSTLRPQGVEIIRTWAFYSTYRCLMLTGKPCFKELLINGNVLAPDGKKMSKSLGNVIQPDELLKKYPADAIRQWAAMAGAMAKDRPFSNEDIMFAKKFLNKLWNASKYVHSQVGGKFLHRETGVALKTELDLWIVSKLCTLIAEVEKGFESYEYHKLIKKIQEFFWFDFCDYYLEATKSRAYAGEHEIKAIYSFILETSLLLISPITPHISDEVYSRFVEGGCVQKVAFPNTEQCTKYLGGKKIRDGFEQEFKGIIQQVWKAKKEKNLNKLAAISLELPESFRESEQELRSMLRAENFSVTYSGSAKPDQCVKQIS